VNAPDFGHPQRFHHHLNFVCGAWLTANVAVARLFIVFEQLWNFLEWHKTGDAATVLDVEVARNVQWMWPNMRHFAVPDA